MLIRETTVAGTFYPSNKNELNEMIKNYLEQVNISKDINNIKAVVCPHAGYIYSGEVAAYSYKSILNNLSNLSNKTFVLLCPSHYVSLTKVSVGLYDKLRTPIGDLSVNRELGEELLDMYPNFFIDNKLAFKNEHSLELQLPFLKYISGDNDIKVLPLIFGRVDYKEVGRILGYLSKREKLFFIVSSDLSHYNTFYNAIEKDKNTINSFLTMNTGVIAKIADACGIYPWITFNEIAKNNKWSPVLLKYLNSGHTAGDKERVVGYSSLVYI